MLPPFFTDLAEMSSNDLIRPFISAADNDKNLFCISFEVGFIGKAFSIILPVEVFKYCSNC